MIKRVTKFYLAIIIAVPAAFCLTAFADVRTEDTKTIEAINIQRDGLSHLMNYMAIKPDIFARDKTDNPLLNLEEKRDALNVWLIFLDYMSALQTLANDTEDYLTLRGQHREYRKAQHAYALSTQYRFALSFIHRVNDDSELVKWYNLKHKQHGLPKNLYYRFRDQTLSDWNTDKYDSFMATYSPSNDKVLHAHIEQNRADIRELNRTQLMTANSANTIGRKLYRTYYPIQKNVARGIGKVKLWRIGETLITPEQAYAFSRSFEPGDIYLTRKEWRLSNAGIPGYWTHSVLYIGTPEERAAYFDTPEVNKWLADGGYNSFEDLLQTISPAYAVHPKQDSLGDIRALEALDGGVIFNSIETSLDADGAAVFRPRLSKLEKAKAIANAFHYIGLPYDFEFDFDTDSAMVCSELIVKAYQPATTQTGISFPMNTVAGRKMLTPSQMAKWYDDTEGTPEQALDLVMFIDSNEKQRIAFEAPKASFTGTWQRSDWHTFSQPPLVLSDEKDAEKIAANQH